nr:diguanylate cyclase [Leptothrix sp. C29]
MPALRTRFETDFDATEQALAAQTATIASALDSAGLRSGQAVRQARLGLIAAALLTIVAGWSGVATIARSIRNSLMGLRDVAQAVASGDLERRSEHLGRDEVGQLAEAVNDMADALHRMIERMRSDGSRIDFSARLAQALDMADTEAQAHGVVAQAMLQVATDRPMELLLADSSEAHLERAAAHPAVGAPGCCVDSPFSCVAVRRGHAVRFSSSEALDACPRLRGRTGTPVSASCVPVTFMGRALGVLHVTSQAEQPLDDAQLERLVTLAAQAGGRIGMVRAFERTQMQAATDALTGLPNRRTAEARLRRLVGSGQALAFVMADLDHFKRLNDMHGHQAGDEALRTFADVVRECARPQDLVCRWGGEEFAFVLAGVDAAQALHWCERLRSSLQDALQRRSTPVFTASLGVCVCGTGSTPSPESLVAAADAALYQAKSAGRDRAVVSRPGEAGTGAAEPRISEQAATIDISQLVSRT